MSTLQKRIIRITICLMIAAALIVTYLSVLFLRSDERLDTDQLLLLLCETGERNLDYYFNEAENVVRNVSSFAENDLKGLQTAQLEEHVSRVQKYFEEAAYKTDGMLTYYYRIDPAVSDTVKGFWYINLEGKGFEQHEPTDITHYDTNDTSQLVWFTVPKVTGSPIWQAPYITENLDMRVISYNVPIYWRGSFIAVAGIEIDYSTMAKQVESIRLYNDGYAFLCDAKGNLFYHPRIDVIGQTEENGVNIPDGLLSERTFVHYTQDGIEKRAVWLPLENGMRLYVAVPISDTHSSWRRLTLQLSLSAAIVILLLGVFASFYIGHVIKTAE